jgi:hypothetical protein
MKWILGTVLSVSLLAAGCADPVAPATPTPIDANITESFAGTLAVLGANTHPFTVQQVGTVMVTISDITPGAAVNLGVGSQGLSGCSVVRSVTAVNGTTPQLSGVATTTGNFCVSVADPGNLVESVTYNLVVRHP